MGEHVQNALNDLMKGRTTLTIAHRLSTIKGSDKILGFKSGVVVDDGTHDELLAKKDGVYSELWKLSNNGPQKTQPPPLQRSLSRAGKFDILRKIVSETADKDTKNYTCKIIDELEAESEAQKAIADAEAPHVQAQAKLKPGSKWRKVVAAERMGVLAPAKGPR